MSDSKKMAVASSSGSSSSNAPTQPQEEKGFLKKYGGQIVQMLFFWMIMKTLTGGWNSNSQTSSNTHDGASTTSSIPHQPVIAKSGSMITLRDYVQGIPDNVYYFPHPIIPHADLPDTFIPLWQPNTPMEVSVYISENEYFVDYQKKPDFKMTGIHYGQPFEGTEQHLDIPATETIQHNGTVYAHIFVAQDKMPIDPTDTTFNPDSVVYYRHVLTKFYPQKASVKQKNLLKKDDDEEEEEDKTALATDSTSNDAGIVGLGSGILGNLTRRGPLVAHWQQNVTLTLVNDNKNIFPKNGLQPPIMKYVQFDNSLSRTPSGKQGFYRPILFPNDFWTLQQNAYAINKSVSSLPLNIRVEPISVWKFNIFATLDDSMKQQANSPLGGMTSSDIDEIKRMFLETNPVLLGTTIVVSLLHSLFEMLAFKNDIAFWKKKQNSAGISVRTLIVNIFFQIVIFLYLFDNNQETSWMVLISQGFGLVVEIWKVFKALKYELVWTPGSLLPKLGHQEQNAAEKEEEDETAKYDAIAFKYLKWLSYPLLAGYAIYSLYYEEHKSWYSYALKTLVEFVYMFGFITMLPQLYINYRLKSVAHMPWKTLMYKSLNTFIDDLFAFVIKMPTLHRLACLRDDIVFFVYIYQRHIYKVDHSRANEYGQIGEEKDDKKNEETKKDK